jgi:two-component system, cell cycle sensor histidine kinase and response regulator CckA
MAKVTSKGGQAISARVRAKARTLRQPAADDTHAEDEARRLLHELRVHQIELEMQNEELLKSRSQLETVAARLTELYDFAPIGYFTLAADSRIREANLPGAKLLALPRGELVGTRFVQYVAETSRVEFADWLREAFASQAKHSCVIAIDPPKQSTISVEVSSSRSSDGAELRVVVVDITARRALEAQLRQAQKMEVVGQLAGGVAHDFNNLLAAMVLNLASLHGERDLSPRAEQVVRDLDLLAKRAATLTRQLLVFSRRQAISVRHLELNAVLAELLKMLERLLGEHITYVRRAHDPELWLDGDLIMIEQAVMNLCLNARDAMPNGGTLTLETSMVELGAEVAVASEGRRRGRFGCLEVRDTGCGMSAETLTHLYEPFFTTKGVGRGTGLGLASTYGIVTEHRGWLEVESEPGQGTTFRVYFPLAAQQEKSWVVEESSRPGTRRASILLVEDEQQLLTATARALSRFGYTVVTASDGPSALEMWDRHSGAFDLVLTDLRMPKGMSGLDVVEQLRARKPSVKFIVMSGYGLEAPADAASNYVFLPKPFDLKTLDEAIRQSLG